jgi:hypothetical protein
MKRVVFSVVQKVVKKAMETSVAGREASSATLYETETMSRSRQPTKMGYK